MVGILLIIDLTIAIGITLELSRVHNSNRHCQLLAEHQYSKRNELLIIEGASILSWRRGR